MLVNSGVLGNDQGVDGEEHRDVAVQLQHSSLQIHHHSPLWREVEVHVTVHREELRTAALDVLGAGLHEHGEEAGQLHVTRLHQTC